MASVVRYRDFLSFLRRLPHRRQSLLVAVDGCGGSGKSTFARNLSRCATDLTVVSANDFYLPTTIRPTESGVAKPIAGELDWQRLAEQVLVPLSRNEAACYQRYDWPSDSLAEHRTIPPSGGVVVEGVYALLPKLVGYYDYKIWIETSYQDRLARGIERDGLGARERWVRDWMPAEQRYVQVHRPDLAAEMRVDGSRSTGFDFDEEIVRSG